MAIDLRKLPPEEALYADENIVEVFMDPLVFNYIQKTMRGRGLYMVPVKAPRKGVASFVVELLPEESKT